VSFSHTTIADNVLADRIEAAAWKDFFAAAPREMGCEAFEFPATDAVLLRARALPIPIMNRVIGLEYHDLHSGLFPSIMRHYRDADIGGFWVHAWLPAGAGVEWRSIDPASGPESRWCKFLFDLDGSVPVARAPTGAATRIARPDEADRVGDVICRSHGMPPSLVPWFSALVGRPGWRFFVVDGADAAPVAAGALFVDGLHAWLGMGATLPEARCQGAQTALLAARVEAAQALGCTVAAVETGVPDDGAPSPSLNNIRRAGFRAVGVRRNVAFSSDSLQPRPQQAA
jgi:GNAT superfamily N-acetyltransferase